MPGIRIFYVSVLIVYLSPLLLIAQSTDGLEGIKGKSDYIHSPFLTAGDRIYMVGNQDGSFSDIGWHVKGEMGGIWDHPIKLLDGFTASIKYKGNVYCLDQADSFINYPFVNKHIYAGLPENLKINRIQFVPDSLEGIWIGYEIENTSNEELELSFQFTGYSDLRPVWLGERTAMQDHSDTLLYIWNDAWTATDKGNDWYVLFGSAQTPVETLRNNFTCEYNPAGMISAGSLTYSIHLDPKKKKWLKFVIAGSYHSEHQARETYTRIMDHSAELYAQKKNRYELLRETARVTLPDKKIEEVYRWLKYSTDWLIRDVPQTGRGISAGLPDYPWWFGVDSEYSLKAALAIGRFDLAKESIRLLYRMSEKENGNGRVVHEVSTNGAVYNPGNVNETPQFVSLLWQYFLWTGDTEMLKSYYPFVKKGLSWLLEENDQDHNFLPDGFGIMEIHGLDSEMIDVAVYTQQAFDDAAKMAKVMNDPIAQKDYKNVADTLKQIINKRFWVESAHSYADFIGTRAQALVLIENAIHRADSLDKPWAIKELLQSQKRISILPPGKKQGFVLYHNWVVNTPMETGIADKNKALEALETGSKYVNPFGVFVTGIDRDEQAGGDNGSFHTNKKVFSYIGAVMTLPTGVQAVAENRYGRPDRALEYMHRMARSFSFALPGSMYEVSPDYGMMTQAWSLYGFAIPIVEQFFGVKPNAAEKKIRISPEMPTSWDHARIDKLMVGDNQLTIDYTKKGNNVYLIVKQSRPEWHIEFVTDRYDDATWRCNGLEVKPDTGQDGKRYSFSGDSIKLSWEK